MSDMNEQQSYWHSYIRDMLRFCDRVSTYTAGLEFQEFVSDHRTYDAPNRAFDAKPPRIRHPKHPPSEHPSTHTPSRMLMSPVRLAYPARPQGSHKGVPLRARCRSATG